MRELIQLTVQDVDTVDLDVGDSVLVNDDYRRLKNLPTLDGRPIVDDIQEQDPTVPAWAKTPTKPGYNAEEVGAIPEGAIRVLDDGDFWEMLERA